jgi:sterol desaturase/sphingolipid hydroxylase (fatty acid hydroxylase superfamily)
MIAGLERYAGFIAQAVVLFLFIFSVASIVERRHPIEPGQSKRAIFLDRKLAFANIILSQAFAPISGAIAAMGVNLAGGGFITLRADGWWFVLSLSIVVFAVELQGYWFHRLQHCVPFLWSMHSLHHSAEAMTAATGARHYWFEHAIIASFLPSVAMVFKVPAEVLLIMPYLYVTEYMVHMNVKVPFGPLTFVLNTPQFHRIHHSIEPRHYDKNFCKNLPILDIIFGTAWIPGSDEFPRTGLANEKPASLLEGVIWPLRQFSLVRKVVGLVRANPQTIGTTLSSESN